MCVCQLKVNNDNNTEHKNPKYKKTLENQESIESQYFIVGLVSNVKLVRNHSTSIGVIIVFPDKLLSWDGGFVYIIFSAFFNDYIKVAWVF